MPFFTPSLRVGLALGLALLAPAAPALALPGVGLSVGAAVQYPTSDPEALGLAYDLDATLAFGRTGVTASYWSPLGAQRGLAELTLHQNLSPIPMINLYLGVGGALLGGSAGSGYGPLGTLSASWTPLLLPVSLNAGVGAAYLVGAQSGLLLPWQVGVGVGLLPFVSLVGRYRGFAGAPFTLAGPEAGLEIAL